MAYYCAVYATQWGANVERTCRVTFHDSREAACQHAEKKVPAAKPVVDDFVHKSRYARVQVQIGEVKPGQSFVLKDSESYYR